MAFKLKYINVSNPGKSTSPVKKVDSDLIFGAGAGGAGISSNPDIFGAMRKGMALGTTETAIAESEKKTCIEQGLTGVALKDCQNKNEPLDPCSGLTGTAAIDCRKKEHDKIDVAEAARLKKIEENCINDGREYDAENQRCKDIEAPE